MEMKLKGYEGTLLVGCLQNIRPFNFPLTSLQSSSIQRLENKALSH